MPSHPARQRLTSEPSARTPPSYQGRQPEAAAQGPRVGKAPASMQASSLARGALPPFAVPTWDCPSLDGAARWAPGAVAEPV